MVSRNIPVAAAHGGFLAAASRLHGSLYRTSSAISAPVSLTQACRNG